LSAIGASLATSQSGPMALLGAANLTGMRRFFNKNLQRSAFCSMRRIPIEEYWKLKLTNG
jgi:hypothetical protein